MSDLKPCPFCGGSNIKSGGDDKWVGAWCPDCQAVGPNQYYTGQDWNNRATDPATIWREAMEAAANLCNERGMFEQGNLGLNRATQNYFRARNAIRAIPNPYEVTK